VLIASCCVCHSEWAVGNAWLGKNTGAMLLATAYVLLAGSYLEWCMILRARYEVCCTMGACSNSCSAAHNDAAAPVLLCECRLHIMLRVFLYMDAGGPHAAQGCCRGNTLAQGAA
jgi:hypothetical protein